MRVAQATTSDPCGGNAQTGRLARTRSIDNEGAHEHVRRNLTFDRLDEFTKRIEEHAGKIVIPQADTPQEARQARECFVFVSDGPKVTGMVYSTGEEIAHKVCRHQVALDVVASVSIVNHAGAILGPSRHSAFQSAMCGAIWCRNSVPTTGGALPCCASLPCAPLAAPFSF